MTDQPSIVAHRGASGYLPEHTLAAKTLAHLQGADYLEQDVVVTRDGRLIVTHDLFLERTTDVAAAFANRARSDGHFYAIDFDWAEIAQLRVTGMPSDLSMLGEHAALLGAEPARICSLDEELEHIQRLNVSLGRQVGIYPEIKEPLWHAMHGFDATRALVDALREHGYESGDGSVFVQCLRWDRAPAHSIRAAEPDSTRAAGRCEHGRAAARCCRIGRGSRLTRRRSHRITASSFALETTARQPSTRSHDVRGMRASRCIPTRSIVRDCRASRRVWRTSYTPRSSCSAPKRSSATFPTSP